MKMPRRFQKVLEFWAAPKGCSGSVGPRKEIKEDTLQLTLEAVDKNHGASYRELIEDLSLETECSFFQLLE